jgi:hypothetical protein
VGEIAVGDETIGVRTAEAIAINRVARVVVEAVRNAAVAIGIVIAKSRRGIRINREFRSVRAARRRCTQAVTESTKDLRMESIRMDRCRWIRVPSLSAVLATKVIP